MNSTSSARCRTTRLRGGERGPRRPHLAHAAGRRSPATRLRRRAGGGRGRGSAAASASSLCAVATPARASASAAVNGRGSTVNSSWPLRTMAPSREVDCRRSGRRRAGAPRPSGSPRSGRHNRPTGSLRSARVPRPSPWGVGGAAAGEGSLVHKVTAAASATMGVPVIAARCHSGTVARILTRRGFASPSEATLVIIFMRQSFACVLRAELMQPAISSYWSGEKPAERNCATSSPGTVKPKCQVSTAIRRSASSLGSASSGFPRATKPVPEAAKAASGADRPQPVDAREKRITDHSSAEKSGLRGSNRSRGQAIRLGVMRVDLCQIGHALLPLFAGRAHRSPETGSRRVRLFSARRNLFRRSSGFDAIQLSLVTKLFDGRQDPPKTGDRSAIASLPVRFKAVGSRSFCTGQYKVR